MGVPIVKNIICVTIERELLKELDSYIEERKKERKGKRSRSSVIEEIMENFLYQQRKGKPDMSVTKP